MYNFAKKRKIWNVYGYRLCISAEWKCFFKSAICMTFNRKTVTRNISLLPCKSLLQNQKRINWTFYGRGNSIFTSVVGVTGTVWELVISIQLSFTGWKTSNIKEVGWQCINMCTFPIVWEGLATPYFVAIAMTHVNRSPVLTNHVSVC